MQDKYTYYLKQKKKSIFSDFVSTQLGACLHFTIPFKFTGLKTNPDSVSCNSCIPLFRDRSGAHLTQVWSSVHGGNDVTEQPLLLSQKTHSAFKTN